MARDDLCGLVTMSLKEKTERHSSVHIKDAKLRGAEIQRTIVVDDILQPPPPLPLPPLVVGKMVISLWRGNLLIHIHM